MNSKKLSTIEKFIKDYGIGLTGGIATGKSTVGQILQRLGAVVIDADALSRQAVLPGSTAIELISREFGKDHLNAAGSMNREKMRGTAFSDPAALSKLESIVHPEIQKLLKQELENLKLIDIPRPWFYEAALLIEKDLVAKFKEIWVIYCEEGSQLGRLINRDKITEADAKKILAQQMPSSRKLDFADVKIDTDCGLINLDGHIETQYQLLLERHN